MPYIIAVLIMAVIGTGFALTKTDDTDLAVAVTPATTETMSDPAYETETTTTIDTAPVAAGTADETVAETAATSESADAPIVVATPATETNVTEVIPTETITETVAVTPVETVTSVTTNSGTYADGTYTASENYRIPGHGSYSLTVTFAVEDDVVTDSSISFSNNAARDRYSQRFLSSYESKVLGEDLGDIDLSRVAGASFTTNAFNEAVDSITSQAIL